MALRTLSNPTVVINNIAIAVSGNSVSFTEGFGERDLRVQSAGGSSRQSVFTENVETQLSMVKLSLVNTAANAALVRTWLNNLNENAITITGEGLTRSFSNAAVINDPEMNLGSDGTFDVEFKSDSAV